MAGAVFPTGCVACGALICAHDPPLCQDCWARIPRLGATRCRCGVELPGSPGEECGRCRRGLSVISRGAALGVYAGPLRDCVVALKYRGRHKTAERLARRILECSFCQDVLDGADSLVAVPLHDDRERERGFNQAELIACALARFRPVRVSRALIRARRTESQTHLSARDRRRNVRDAFAVTSDLSVRNAVLVMVDDVTTTGATIRECALTLLDHGVREVRAITVARAE